MPFKPLDITTLFTTEPHPLDFVYRGHLAGTVGALIAPGGSGKSMWALELAIGIACRDADQHLLNIKPPREGKVVFFSGEDPNAVLHQRIHAISKIINSNSYQLKIAKNLFVIDLHGEDKNIEEYNFVKNMIDILKDARLGIIDTFSRFHQKDENSNSEMAKMIHNLEVISKSSNAALLFLHHASKASAFSGQGDQQQASRGASALIDNTRYQSYVLTMSEHEAKIYKIKPEDRRKYVRYNAAKQNYAQIGDDVWYERKQGGVLIPTKLLPAVAPTHSPQAPAKNISPREAGKARGSSRAGTGNSEPLS